MRISKSPPQWPSESSHWADFGGREADREGEEGTLDFSRPGTNPPLYLLWWGDMLVLF